jgi:hypothetical protein
MNAMTFEPDEIPTSPANWTQHVYWLCLRHLWLRGHPIGLRATNPDSP